MRTNKLALLALAGLLGAQGPRHEFEPGEVWLDAAGKPIQAHGGGILKVDSPRGAADAPSPARPLAGSPAA